MPNPFFDRRDMTDDRNAAAQATAPGSMHPLRTVETNLAAIVAEMQTTTELMHRQLLADRVELTQLCVTDRKPAQAAMENFPVPSARRLIVRRTGSGSDVALAAATTTQLCHPNETRLGGTICNYGSAIVKLYLCELGLVQEGETAGYPVLGLGSGQSWDFRLGTLVWCGTVVAVAGAGGSSVTVAEV